GLAHEGYATAAIGRPRQYAAMAPGLVFSALRLHAEQALRRFASAEAELVPQLEAVRNSGPPPVQPQFTLLRGVDALAGHAQQVYGAARARIDVVLGPQSGRALHQAFSPLELLRQRARDG